jgi:hypothetical protein
VPPDSTNQNSINNNPQVENASSNDDDEDCTSTSLMDQSKRVGDSPNANVKEDVDPDALVDVDPAIIENESKILAAAKHVHGQSTTNAFSASNQAGQRRFSI